MVRRAAVGDEAALREIRLRALGDAPEAFGSTLERERARTTADWQRWFAPGATFLASHGDRPIGLVAGSHDPGDAAIIHLQAMWVDPVARGSGTADALVSALLEWAAAENAREVRLTVIAENRRAIGLYARHGFRLTAAESVRERDGAAECQMVRLLGRADSGN